MQTRNFGLRAVTLALAGVLTLGLAACEETKVVTPDDPTELTVSPQGPLDLQVGQTIQLVSNVTNADAGATVTWATSDANVATVSTSGLVTAVASGTATVTASVPAREGGTRQVGVQIRVGGGGQGGDAAVVIEGVFDQNNEPVNPDNVQGTVFLRLAVEKADADSLVVFASGQSLDAVVCRQLFNDAASTSEVSAAAIPATLVCPINTAAFDPNTFVAAFANGPMQLTARLFDEGQAVATAATGALTLANRDIVLVSVDVNNTDWDVTRAIDPRDNQLWVGGEVTVTGQPVIYSGTSMAGLRGQIGLDIFGFTNPVASVVAGEDGRLVATFPEDVLPANGGVQGVESEFVEPFINGLTTGAGQVARLDQVFVTSDFQAEEPVQVPGGQTFANYFRLDNQAPNTFPLRTDVFDFGTADAAAVSFVNGDFAFTDANTRLIREADRPANPDEGVNTVRYSFFAAAGNVSDANFFNDAVQVNTGRDLAESETSTAYRLAVVVRDSLGNADTIYTAPGVTFGVDTTAPRLSFAAGSVADEAKFGLGNAPPVNASWLVTAFDTTSAAGFTATPIRATVTGLNAAGSFCIEDNTFPTTAGPQDLPGRLVSGVCVETSDDNSTPVPTLAATDAYYTYTAYAVDQAGNRSNVLTRTIVVDDEDPTVRNIIFPSSFTAMQASGILADVQDNLDLESFDVREVFPVTGYDGNATIALPFAARQVIDPSFDSTLVTDRRVTDNGPFVRSFDIFANADAFSAPSAFRVRVTDAAQNATERDEVAPAFVQTPTLAQYTAAPAGLTTWSIASSLATISISGNTATTLTATLEGTPALENSPFANGRVAFYFYNGITIEYIGEATGVQTVRDAAGNLTVTYTRSWTPDVVSAVLPGHHAVFAVGITPAGDALGTSNAVAVVANP